MRQFVFISHSNKDKPQLGPLIEAIKAAGITVWIDNPAGLGYTAEQVERDFLRLHAGGRWEDEIAEAHNKAGVVLAVWSKDVVAAFAPAALESGRILREEIVKARGDGKLICCRIDDTSPSTYPANFNREQVAEIRPGDPEYAAKLGGLVRDVQDKLRAIALRAYYADRHREWSDPKYGAGDKLFTDLALLLDRGADADERWSKKRRTTRRLTPCCEGIPSIGHWFFWEVRAPERAPYCATSTSKPPRRV